MEKTDLKRSASLWLFVALCVVCEAALLVYDRTDAYIGLGAFAYSGILWLIARACIPLDPDSEDNAIKTTAQGSRLLLRLVVVILTVFFIWWRLTPAGLRLVWNGSVVNAARHFSAIIGLGYGNSALPNFLVELVIPAALLFALGATLRELGVLPWRKGGWKALAGAFVLPAIFIGMWFAKSPHASIGMLGFLLVSNFLSNGISEEFSMRGMLLSHLRAFLSKDWSVAIQAVIFGLLHYDGTAGDIRGNALLAVAFAIALNAPTGYFLGLIALRARSILLPGLIHMSLDLMKDLMG